MATRVVDFDAFRRARDANAGEVEPVVFRLGGTDYHLPPEPPATVVLDALRLEETLKDRSRIVPLKALRDMGYALFGEKQFRKMLEDNGVGAAEMGDLILEAFKAWPDLLEEAPPNREARRRAGSTSSKTGRSSKPTSGASTD